MIHILHLEDSERDAELIHTMINNSEIPHNYSLAENMEDFQTILRTNKIDMVLSDYSLPNYSGQEALELVRDEFSKMPFIFVSGAMGEDKAIEALVNGATDYVLKNKLERLIPAIKRALNEQELETKRIQFEKSLIEKSNLIAAQNEQYIIINNELAFQNSEKEKRAGELITANVELAYQNIEKENRASELILANYELAFQNSEKEKRAIELNNSNTELLKAEEQFRLVVESSPHAIVLVDKDGIIALVNQKTEELFGYERNELIGNAVDLIIPNRFKNLQQQHLPNTKTNSNSDYFKTGTDLFAIHKNNNEILVEIGLNPLETAKGAMVLATILDITERKKQELDLLTLNKKLISQNNEKELRAAELILANKELLYQNNEKEKRAAELLIANHELFFRNEDIAKKATELITANIQKAEAAKTRLIIEAKNKNITDSIYYAKRIQMAKLPKKEIIYESLPESFILFKPKDIVSGDFYFFHKTVSNVFLVAADCTGHGVPGAFMSMIGTDKLTEAFALSTNTSDILKFLNRGIKSALHQSDSRESTRDGMDIAICSINKEQKTVQYAGANRPIWVIRKDTNEVEEIKATKKAIGGFTDNDQVFDTHSLNLNKGDTFYIFTDGYADQFGGNLGKKLMTKIFKGILIRIQSLSMAEQEAYLEKYIEGWRANNEQVDDILVVGVRL